MRRRLTALRENCAADRSSGSEASTASRPRCCLNGVTNKTSHNQTSFTETHTLMQISQPEASCGHEQFIQGELRVDEECAQCKMITRNMTTNDKIIYRTECVTTSVLIIKDQIYGGWIVW